MVFIATHLLRTSSSGLSARTGAVVLALVGLFNIAGSYIAGVLGNRMSKPGVLVGIYALRAAVIATFVALPVTETTAYAFGAAMGLLWLSTVPLTNTHGRDRLRRDEHVDAGGVVFFFHQVGALPRRLARRARLRDDGQLPQARLVALESGSPSPPRG